MVAGIGLAHWHSNPFEPFIPPGQTLFQSIGAGIAIGMWMYSGYESMSTMAGELEDPQLIPKATLIAIPSDHSDVHPAHYGRARLHWALD